MSRHTNTYTRAQRGFGFPYSGWVSALWTLWRRLCWELLWCWWQETHLRLASSAITCRAAGGVERTGWLQHPPQERQNIKQLICHYITLQRQEWRASFSSSHCKRLWNVYRMSPAGCTSRRKETRRHNICFVSGGRDHTQSSCVTAASAKATQNQCGCRSEPGGT